MPTLVDTSVWIDHLRSDSPGLRRMLDENLVVCHPLIIGELACGQMKRRTEVLVSLAELPAIPMIEHEELLAFIETHKHLDKVWDGSMCISLHRRFVIASHCGLAISH